MRFKPVPSYTPIRNDESSGRISQNERAFVATALPLGWRLDGRTAQQLRPARLRWTRNTQGHAACTVNWGANIQVQAACQGRLGPPLRPTERPQEGSLQIWVQFSPMASTAVKYGLPLTNGGNQADTAAGSSSAKRLTDDASAQRLATNHILRVLEALLLGGQQASAGAALDSEALVVTPGKWVWHLELRVVIWDVEQGPLEEACSGAVVDAAVLAALAALQHYRQPAVVLTDETDDLSYSNNKSNRAGAQAANPPQTVDLDQKEGSPLPLHHLPLCLSLGWIHSQGSDDENKGSVAPLDATNLMIGDEQVNMVVDPSAVELAVIDGGLTIALSPHGEVCGLWTTRGILSQSLLKRAEQTARQHLQELHQALQHGLSEAHQQALQDGLARVEQLQHRVQEELQLPGDNSNSGDNMDLSNTETQDKATEASTTVWDQAAAEEAYRKQALEYNSGHQAVKVRETTRTQSSTPALTKKATSSRLLQTLLRSATSAATLPPQPEETLPPMPPATTTVPTMPRPSGKSPFASPSADDTSKKGVAESTKAKPKAPTQTRTQSSITKDKPPPQGDDSEEETTMMLQSEFATVSSSPSIQVKPETPVKSTTSKPREVAKETAPAPAPLPKQKETLTPGSTAKPDALKSLPNADDEVDDLAAAIKKKKKKKGKR